MKTKNCKKKPKSFTNNTLISQTIKRRKTVCLAYQQGNVFEKLKENAKFSEMIKHFGVGKFTIKFKVNIMKLTKKHPKIKKSSLLYFS